MRLLSRTIALAGALLVVAAPAAIAEPTADESQAAKVLLKDHLNGGIAPCDYTVEELQTGLDGITADYRQYASDFPAAVRDAIAAHARGTCDAPVATPTPAPTVTVAPEAPTGGAAPPTAPGTPGAADPGAQTIVPDPPAPAVVASTPQLSGADPALERAAAAAPGSDTPVPLIGLGVLSALALLTVLMLSALRRLGFAGGPLAPTYHTWREAQWRAGGVWEDFRDWVRVGR